MKTATLKQLLQDKADKRAVVLITDLGSGAEELVYPYEKYCGSGMHDLALEVAQSDKSRSVEMDDGRKLFLHAFNPALRMAIVGAVHIAQPLSRMATLAGYDVTVIDPRTHFASPDRFPGLSLSHDWPDEALTALAADARTAVVTLTHDPKMDDPALSTALQSPAFYIGALGSTRTHAKRIERLKAEGFDDADLARINGPVGLNIGAKSPAEIAIAILGQITEALRREPARKELAA
tara:strand:+ start:149 stop:856 length:708 start_codon:yes stop_codon:yes gene_type:complete